MNRSKCVFLVLACGAIALWCATRQATADGGATYGPPPLPAVSAAANPAANPGGGATGGPKMVVPEETHDWGEVFQGEDPRHTFVVRNEGDKPLLINNVKPG
ncbi:MAG: DUF1573 domain-containing protein [Planctomycetes bacterium]|nr:DUF1573 domain-containing protein [Planctomycetota bacterium]